MPSLILKTEVEATPELVIEQLTKFADSMKDQKFPWARGELLMLHEAYLKAVGGIEGMPVYVIASAQGSALGQIAIQKADGDITMAYITAAQVNQEYVKP